MTRKPAENRDGTGWHLEPADAATPAPLTVTGEDVDRVADIIGNGVLRVDDPETIARAVLDEARRILLTITEEDVEAVARVIYAKRFAGSFAGPTRSETRRAGECRLDARAALDEFVKRKKGGRMQHTLEDCANEVLRRAFNPGARIDPMDPAGTFFPTVHHGRRAVIVAEGSGEGGGE